MKLTEKRPTMISTWHKINAERGKTGIKLTGTEAKPR